MLNFVVFPHKMSDDHDARTIHCGNLYADKITEELLYELFVQVCKLIASEELRFFFL